jgi:hypothetical protein
MHDVMTPDRPAVPVPKSGTVGQSTGGTDISRTDCGTVSGTMSLKALANRVLMRDKAWDTKRDSAAQAPLITVPAARSRETSIGTDPRWQADALRMPPSWADASGPPPAGAWCACCKGQRWWCEAIAPSGWRCRACHPPDHLGADDVREVCPGMWQTRE